MPDLTVRAVTSGPYATFRPRASRWVAAVFAVLVLVAYGFFALTAEGELASSGNRASFIGFAVVVALLLWRLGGVRADVDPQGIRVRNVFSTATYTWAEVVSVRFGADQPWLRLDLSDGDTVAVMAVQRADGARAESEARRLASLAAAHGEGREPERGTPTH